MIRTKCKGCRHVFDHHWLHKGQCGKCRGLPVVTAMGTQYHKVYFSDGQGNRTAGLILTREELGTKGASELSRLFPASEFRKMSYLYVSPAFGSFDEAFAHNPEVA